MNHLMQLVPSCDARVDALLASQTPSGEYVPGNLFTDTRNQGFSISQVFFAYLTPESRHCLKESVADSLSLALSWEEEHLRENGSMDLATCNFASAPDTAFTVNALLMPLMYLHTNESLAALPGVASLADRLRHLIFRACEGIIAGGFHTPNHRWAIAACLKTAGRLLENQDFSRTADLYLAEGLDIDADGEFAERSTGTYNLVNDDQMIRLYLATGERMYLDAACANLRMMRCYMEPDDTIFTMNSTRQDHGTRVYPEGYAILCALCGYLSEDASLLDDAEKYFQASLRHGRVPRGLEWLKIFPDMDAMMRKGDHHPVEYHRFFPASGIVRLRRDTWSMTLLDGKPDFLYFQSQTQRLSMSIYANVCDKRHFLSSGITREEDGYTLCCHWDSWYYEPFGEERETRDWWQMDNEHTRQKKILGGLDMHIHVKPLPDGFSMRIKATGLDRVPVRLEVTLPSGTLLRGESFFMRTVPGSSVHAQEGFLESQADDGSILSFGPCFSEHMVQYRMGNALPQSSDGFTAFLNALTPFDREITFSTKKVFPYTA
ncbi:MAG: hypothetical protein IJ083_15925 [Clostridia bacterium]|nr:hypothetical protein [Clostridia bacterium]